LKKKLDFEHNVHLVIYVLIFQNGKLYSVSLSKCFIRPQCTTHNNKWHWSAATILSNSNHTKY